MTKCKKSGAKQNGSVRNKKSKKDYLQNIVSLRINDKQKTALEKMSASTSKSISDIIREALNLWGAKQRKLCVID